MTQVNTNSIDCRLQKGYAEDAGIDIILNDIARFPAQNVTTVCLNIVLPTDAGSCGILVARSSTAKSGLIMQPILIDPGYEGYLHAVVYNATNNEVVYEEGSSFCSIVWLKTHDQYFENEVRIKKPGQKRGKGAFGSSDK